MSKRHRTLVSDLSRRWWRDIGTIAGLIGLLLLGTLLPPDTTLRDVKRAGQLRVCTPNTFPPLVLPDSQRPGFDIELLELIASDLDVRLIRHTSTNMGRDFNPRSWRITRSQCLALAGGVVDTVTTRGYLVTVPTGLETGWSAVSAVQPPSSLDSATVGFYAGLSGLDRLTLSRWLRERNASVVVVSDLTEARSGLEDGRFDILVTEALTARQLADEVGGTAMWISPVEERVSLALGLWKGDLTLERAVSRSIARRVRDGTVAVLAERYDLGPIEEECPFCR